MKRAIRWMLFLLAFQIDVRVKASGLDSSHGHSEEPKKVYEKPYTVFPRNCIEQSIFPCAISSLDLYSQHFFEFYSIGLSPDGVVILESPTKLHILTGEILVWSKSETTSVFSAKGHFVQTAGKALYKISPSSLFVDTLNSQLLYEQEDKGVAVCEGCQRQFFGYDKDGKLVESIQRASDFVSVVKRWSFLTFLSRNEFFYEARQFGRKNKALILHFSDLYKESIERAIASHQEMLEEQARKKASYEAESKRLRSIFRKMNDIYY